jgi:hypothetical protein
VARIFGLVTQAARQVLVEVAKRAGVVAARIQELHGVVLAHVLHPSIGGVRIKATTEHIVSQARHARNT